MRPFTIGATVAYNCLYLLTMDLPYLWQQFIEARLYGHSVFWLVVDVELALQALILVLIFAWVLKKKHWLFTLLVGYVTLLYFPNAAYLVLEIRHLFLIDQVADAPEIGSVLVFGGLSLLGVIIATATNLTAISKIEVLRKNPKIAAGLLSFTAAFGTALGLKMLESLNGLFNPLLIIKTSLAVLQDIPAMIFVILFTAFLALVTIIAARLLIRPGGWF